MPPALWIAAGLIAGGGTVSSPADSTATQPLPVYRVAPIRVAAPRVVRGRALPGARTILDRAWLTRRDPANLAEALLPVAGLRVMDLGDGSGSTLSLRGLGAERVAVLLDGRPLNRAQGGGVELQPLDPEGLERIEIWRGASAARFGPDALAGAVNLVRRRDRRRTFTVRVLGGTERRGLARVRASTVRDRWDLETAMRLETFSPSVGASPTTARGAGGRLALTYHPAFAAAVETEVEQQYDRRDVPGSRAFPSPEANRTDRLRSVRTALRGREGFGGTFDLDLSLLEQRREYRDPGAPLGAVEDVHRNRRGRVALAWKNPAGITLEAEAVADRLVSTTDGRRRRPRAGVGLRVDRTRGPWGLAFALRADAVRGVSPGLGGRLTVSRTLARGDRRWTARLGAGTGFRPPTFDDLFWPARASAAGNPDLDPERAYDLDAGLGFEGGGARVEASAFATWIHDLIQWTPGADGVWRPHNTDHTRLAGLELAGETPLPPAGLPLRLRGAYTWLNARDTGEDPLTGGRRLVGRAAHRLVADLLFEPSVWSLAVGVRGTGRIPWTAANTKWVTGYLLWNARVRFRVTQTLRLDLEGENLADTPYEDLRGYPTAGREMTLGFRWKPAP